jgi:hypothetical protein
VTEKNHPLFTRCSSPHASLLGRFRTRFDAALVGFDTR